MTIDPLSLDSLQEFGVNVVMAGAKRCLERDGYIVPMAFIFSPDPDPATGKLKVAQTPVPMENKQEKRQSFLAISEFAKALRSPAVIFICDSYVKVITESERSAFMERYRHGDLSVDPEASEAIMVSIRGPGFKACGLQQLYRRGPTGDIEYADPQDWMEIDINNTIPEWFEHSKEKT